MTAVTVAALLGALASTTLWADTCTIQYTVTEAGKPVMQPVNVEVKGNTFVAKYTTHAGSVHVPCGWKGVVRAEYRGIVKQREAEFRVIPAHREHIIKLNFDYAARMK